MAPGEGCLGTSLKRDYSTSLLCGVGSAVADDIVGGNIVDRTVVGRDTHAVTNFAAVNGDKDGVCRGSRRRSRENKGS